MLHTILWAIIGLLVIFWLFGLFLRIGRCLIHVLLVIAAIVLVVNLISLAYNMF